MSSHLTEETEADICPQCRYTFVWRCITDTCSCKWFTAASIPSPSSQKCKNCEGVMWIDGERRMVEMTGCLDKVNCAVQGGMEAASISFEGLRKTCCRRSQPSCHLVVGQSTTWSQYTNSKVQEGLLHCLQNRGPNQLMQPFPPASHLHLQGQSR